MARPRRQPDMNVIIDKVNAARRAMGVRGRPITKLPSDGSCPLSAALGRHVGPEYVSFSSMPEAEQVKTAWHVRTPIRRRGSEALVALPSELERFVDMYDRDLLEEEYSQ